MKVVNTNADLQDSPLSVEGESQFVMHTDPSWPVSESASREDGDGDTPESNAELRLQNSSLRAELKATRSKLDHLQRQHELVQGQQRNQLRAASALQDRLAELEQEGGQRDTRVSVETEERVQALEADLEEERGVTAVLLGRLIDADAKVQEHQKRTERIQKELDQQKATAAQREKKLQTRLDESVARLQKESASVVRLETRLLTAEQSLKRERVSTGSLLSRMEGAGDMSEASRCYMADLENQLIHMEAVLAEERNKCAFMQMKAQETEQQLIQAGAEVFALQTALCTAGLLPGPLLDSPTKSEKLHGAEADVPEGSRGAVLCQQEATSLLEHVQELVNSLPLDVGAESPSEVSSAVAHSCQRKGRLLALGPFRAANMPPTPEQQEEMETARSRTLAVPSHLYKSTETKPSDDDLPCESIAMRASGTSVIPPPSRLGMVSSLRVEVPCDNPCDPTWGGAETLRSQGDESATPMFSAKDNMALRSFDPFIGEDYSSDDEDEDGEGGSPDHVNHVDPMGSPTGSQYLSPAQKPAGGKTKLGSELLPLLADSAAQGPSKLQKEGFGGLTWDPQEDSAADQGFTVKAHYGNPTQKQGGGTTVVPPARLSSRLSSRIALFESGAVQSDGAITTASVAVRGLEGEAYSKVKVDSLEGGFASEPGVSDDARREQASREEGGQIEPAVRPARLPEASDCASASASLTAHGGPQQQQQHNGAAVPHTDVSGNRSLRLKALQEKAALLHDPGQSAVSSHSKGDSACSGSGAPLAKAHGGSEGAGPASPVRRASGASRFSGTSADHALCSEATWDSGAVGGASKSGIKQLRAALEAAGLGAKPVRKATLPEGLSPCRPSSLSSRHARSHLDSLTSASVSSSTSSLHANGNKTPNSPMVQARSPTRNSNLQPPPRSSPVRYVAYGQGVKSPLAPSGLAADMCGAALRKSGEEASNLGKFGVAPWHKGQTGLPAQLRQGVNQRVAVHPLDDDPLQDDTGANAGVMGRVMVEHNMVQTAEAHAISGLIARNVAHAKHDPGDVEVGLLKGLQQEVRTASQDENSPGDADEDAFHTPISSPRARESRPSPPEDEASSADDRTSGRRVDDEEEEGEAPGSPLPSVQGTAIISPLRVGTARSDAEAAAELDALGDGAPEGRPADVDDAHGFPEAGILDSQDVGGGGAHMDSVQAERETLEESAKHMEELVMWAAKRDQQLAADAEAAADHGKLVPASQNAIHTLQQARNQARASGMLPPVPNVPTTHLMRPDMLKARRWDKLRRWAARRNGNGGPLDTVVEDSFSEKGSQYSSSSMQRPDSAGSFSVALSSHSGHSMDSPAPSSQCSDGPLTPQPSSGIKGVVSKVRKLVAVFEKKEVSLSQGDSPLKRGMTPTKRGAPESTSVPNFRSGWGARRSLDGNFMAGMEGSSGDQGLMPGTPGTPRVPRPGQPAYKQREIVGLPAARFSGKQEGPAEELANHPILLRKSRLWDCIPGRPSSVDDGMSDESSRRGIGRLLRRNESGDSLLSDPSRATSGRHLDGKGQARDMYYSMMDGGGRIRRRPVQIIFIRSQDPEWAGHKKRRLHYLRHNGPVIVCVRLRLPRGRANLKDARLLSVQMLPHRTQVRKRRPAPIRLARGHKRFCMEARRARMRLRKRYQLPRAAGLKR